MHEMSFCQSMLRLIEGKAESEPFERVLVIRIELGEYSGASEDSLEFCFPIVAKGTLAEGASLEFLHVPGHALRIRDLDVV